jgi:uncharacterized membrane protein YcaP (DUF421 family)
MYPGFLIPEVSLVEKIVRPLVVYIFLLAAFRVIGKRELGSMSPFDLIILLTISNVVQNAMIGADNSLTGGLIGATTLLVANEAVARLSFRSHRFELLVQGEPTVLIENGKILEKNLEKEALTLDDLWLALRKNQVDPDTDLAAIRRAELESDGSITITRRHSADRSLQQRRRGKTKRVD